MIVAQKPDQEHSKLKVVQHVIGEADELWKKQVNQVALLHLTDTDE